jgi:EAL domain-containing protein (putative c-di-GMP-specific phosphodiesterase class I)
MSYLHKFPFDVLKIDRSFKMRMAVDREAFGIIKTICALAAELGKSVIAEGVERREHQKMLSDVGRQYGQDYLFSKPVDA